MNHIFIIERLTFNVMQIHTMMVVAENEDNARRWAQGYDKTDKDNIWLDLKTMCMKIGVADEHVSKGVRISCHAFADSYNPAGQLI